MTKKILIDEAVVKEALFRLNGWAQAYGCNADTDACDDLREALEVNNKGVDALAEPLTLDDLKVLRKAARCLQWAIQTESFLEKVAPGGHSNEEDYGDAAEGLKRICEKYSITPKTAEPVAPPINVAVMPCGATVANVYEACEDLKRTVQQEALLKQ